MRKYIFTTAIILIFTVNLLGWPMFVFAAPDTVSINNDINVDLWGSGKTLTLKSGGEVAGFTVYSTYLSINLESGSQLTIVSSDGYVLISDIGVPVCDVPVSGQSQVYLSSTTTQTVTVTPSTTNCSARISSGSGGGGGSSTTTTTTTTTTTDTQTTATASSGGTTTLTTGDNSTATAELPVNAVVSSTDIKISAENKTEVASAQPTLSGKSVVGNYVYNFTATSGGASVTTFSKDVTLVFTYTDSQISGLNEDSLKAYYWDGSKWTALTGTLDKTNNKITVLTNHFTYFAIMGDTTTTMAKPSDYGLKEGDLIRAEGDFDIFIISQNGYKRLFLNPIIFNMYGHLGGWKAVKTISTATRNAFITSHYYRYVDSPKVYQMKVTGEDTGTLHWINMTAENFLAQGGKGETIFIINKSELDWYSKGADVTSLK